MREIMKKLSFASPILLTTILLFAAACGKNTATETVPPPHTASEADFSEETSMSGQTNSITPESSAADLIGNDPSETASGSNSNGNSAANGTAAETQDGLISGKTATVTGKRTLCSSSFPMTERLTHFPMIPTSARTGSIRSNPATA